jgi:hypothetical protein
LEAIMGFDVRRGGGHVTGSAVVAKFPRRPNSGVLSESIPLFFIGRNKLGLWVAREAQGGAGGVFLFKRSALRFANRNSAPPGCATMSLSERLELDVENQGNPLAAWLIRFVSRLSNLIPKYPPPIALARQNLKKGGWR